MTELEARRIARAVAAAAAGDPVAAEHAQVALDAITGGEGLDLLDQQGLQHFLWYRLPTRWLTGLDEHHQVAHALGRVLTQLGLDRYAAICASTTTHDLLDRWEVDPEGAHAGFHDAMTASGVVPVDTPTFAWSDAMGLVEAAADAAVARHLEAAVVDGRLRPGTRGAAKVHADLVDEALDLPARLDDADLLDDASFADHGPADAEVDAEVGDAEVDDAEVRGGSGGRPTWRDAVAAERVDRWAQARSRERARLFGRVVDQVRVTPDPPHELDRVVGPVRFLLTQAADGLPLIGTHRLKPAFVTDLADRFGWWAPGTRRLEDDVSEVWRTRELAEALGAVRRRKDRLHLTPRGRELVDDPAALWWAVAGTLTAGDDFAATCRQVGLVVLLDAGTIHEGTLIARLHEVLTAEGWRDQATGEPVDRQTVRWHGWGSTPQLELLGLVEPPHPTDHPELTLTDVGRTTVRAALHQVATGPARLPG